MLLTPAPFPLFQRLTDPCSTKTLKKKKGDHRPQKSLDDPAIFSVKDGSIYTHDFVTEVLNHSLFYCYGTSIKMK